MIPTSTVALDAPAAADACARRVIELLGDTLSRQAAASFAISGGSTPKLLFERLAASGFAWDRVHLFWVDERCVPPNDDASNYKMAYDRLISPARIPADNIHRIEGEREPHEAAERYVAEIRRFFRLEPGAAPRFDVMHRGIGPDAHTASLFPDSPLIDDRAGIAAAVFAPQFQQWRVTLLPAAIEAAHNTVMLVSGADKVDALRAVFHGPRLPKRCPAQIGAERAEWFLDRAAGAGLSIR
jgi:6-phosphogluconolactonase